MYALAPSSTYLTSSAISMLSFEFDTLPPNPPKTLVVKESARPKGDIDGDGDKERQGVKTIECSLTGG